MGRETFLLQCSKNIQYMEKAVSKINKNTTKSLQIRL